MEIKNVSIIKMEEITKTTTKNILRSQKTMWICMAIVLLCSIYMIVSGDVALGVTFIIIGLLFPLTTFILKNAVAKKMNAANKVLGSGIYYEYIFKKDGFKVSTVAGEHTSINEINYTNLNKIQVVDDMIFLFVSANNAYVVKKDGFTNDDECQILLNLFKENLAYKFNEIKK